jgi:5'-phosphate synthase pdxT subunit
MATLPVEVTRNYYGRQLGSFKREVVLDGKKIDLTFVRAPIVKQVHADVKVLLKLDHLIVAVQYGNQIGLSFHPELTKQTYFHEKLLNLIQKK